MPNPVSPTTPTPARPRTTETGNAPSMSDVGAGRNVLMRGHQGDSVRQLQAMMADMGYYKGPLDGKFGPQTEAALKEFQKKHGLEPDGMFGKKSYDKMTSKEVQRDHGAPGVNPGDGKTPPNPTEEARMREYARGLAKEKMDSIRSRPWDQSTLDDPTKRADRVAQSRRDLEGVEKYIERLPQGSEERIALQQRVDQLKEYYSKLEGRYWMQGLGSSIQRDANEALRLEEELKGRIARGGAS